MYMNILHGTLEIPSFLSFDIRSLISQLLIRCPQRRLGAQRGVEEIKEHPFLRDVDWQRVLNKEITPPIVPSLRESNFDSEFRALPARLSEEDEGELSPKSRERTLSEPNLNDIAIRAAPVQQPPRADGTSTPTVAGGGTRQQPQASKKQFLSPTFRGYSFAKEGGGSQLRVPEDDTMSLRGGRNSSWSSILFEEEGASSFVA